MEPTINGIVISELKKNLKEIGNITLSLCGSQNPNPDTRDKAQKINKLAHEMYELIWLEENSQKQEVTMNSLKEAGVNRS
jgi:hypothetical protein